VEEYNINRDPGFQRDCLWFCFSELLQNDLDRFVEYWNTHTIRKSRNDTVSGTPNALYYLPEQYGGTANLLLNVPHCEIDYAKNNLIEKEEDIVHFEYLEYLMNTCEYSKPTNWREALELLKELIQASGQQ
jgi:hypothetical protein